MSRPGPVVLAVELGCSAILAFATAAPRFTSWRAWAIALVVVAWAQIAVAVGGLLRPTRPRFVCAAVVGGIAGGVWAFTVAGGHGVSHFGGGVGIALAAAAVVSAGILILRPRLGASWAPSATVLSSVVPVAGADDTPPE
jgi:hypothetical protein